MTVSEQLKKAINSSELSIYKIAQEARIDQATLRRFMHEDADIRISTVNKLAEFFGLEMRQSRTSKR